MKLFLNDLLVLRHGHSSYRNFWEALKENIETYILSYSKHKRREALQQKVLLTKRLIYLKNLLACGDSSVQPEILEAEASLLALLNSDLRERKIRSRVRWMEEGEAPSAFFCET